MPDYDGSRRFILYHIAASAARLPGSGALAIAASAAGTARPTTTTVIETPMRRTERTQASSVRVLLLNLRCLLVLLVSRVVSAALSSMSSSEGEESAAVVVALEVVESGFGSWAIEPISYRVRSYQPRRAGRGGRTAMGVMLDRLSRLVGCCRRSGSV